MDWVTRVKAARIKSEQLRADFPGQSHPEQAVRDLFRQAVQIQAKTASPAGGEAENAEDAFLYAEVKEVFRGLTEGTEEGRNKNFLGRYKSQLVLDWQVLMRIYEKDNLYLAEYGKVVQQLLSFDVPAQRKQL